MKYLNLEAPATGADFETLSTESKAALESRLIALQERLREHIHAPRAQQARIELDICRVYLGLEQYQTCWDLGRQIFEVFLAEQQWELAVDVCDALFQTELEGALSALGQGVWLAVTYPIDPELSIALLQHIVDETPDDSDGAAVAAITAVYLVDLRATPERRDNLAFFANRLLGTVARRHSNVQTQAQFDYWLQKLELNQPEHFLPRLRNVVDVLVQDDWWFDRDTLRANLPDN